MLKYLKLLIIALVVSLLVACKKVYFPNSLKFKDDVRYIAIKSHMLMKKGVVTTFNAQGNILEEISMPLQDIRNVSVKNESVFFSGARSNDNIIVNNGKLEFFHLLDNDNYTGTTEVLIGDIISYASMNGNVDDQKGYVSLLVARNNQTRKTVFQTIVPLFTTSMCEDERYIYLVGTNAGSRGKDEAVFVVVNKQTGEIEKEYIYSEYREFFDIRKNKDRIFVSATDKKTLNTEIAEFKNGKIVKLHQKITGNLMELTEDILIVNNDNIIYFTDYAGHIKNEFKFSEADLLVKYYLINNIFYLFTETYISDNLQHINVYKYDMKNISLIEKITIPIHSGLGETIIAPINVK